jgi:hypothetical protein
MEKSNWVSLIESLGCQLGKMPFTHLGLPLGTTGPAVQDFSLILTGMERHLLGSSGLLSFPRRLILVNFAYSALPFLLVLPQDANLDSQSN